jgi:hypothetical protein
MELEKILEERINEWELHMKDARYYGDSHYIQRCDCVLTILRNIIKEWRNNENSTTTTK